MKRRDFLKGSLKTGLSLASFAKLAGASSVIGLGAGCSSLDRIFQVQNNSIDDGILIVGGGVAGLVAAFECRKQKIPYRLFEASDRFGGRVQSLRFFNDANQTLELGADYLEPFQKETLQLASELGLELIKNAPSSKLEDEIFATGGKLYRMKEVSSKSKNFRQSLQQLLKSNPEFARGGSVAEMFNQLRSSVDSEMLLSFEQTLQSKFGAEIDQVSSKQWLQYLAEVGSLSPAEQKIFYSFAGGNQSLIDTLAERTGGVIPDFFFRKGMQLVAIREKLGMIECTFKGGSKGFEVIKAGQVLITIPPAMLANVEGWNQLDLPIHWKTMPREARMTSTSRIALGFKEAFWQKRNPENQGTIVGPRLSGVYTDASRGQAGGKAILVCQRGGILGLASGATAPEEMLRELALYYPRVRESYDGNHHVMNWSKRQHIGGALNVFNLESHDKYAGKLSDLQISGQLALAGEAYHDGLTGTVEAAVKSAKAQIKKLLAARRVG